jgi:uncharacterized protein YjbI with pentapeptide repeats
VLLTVLVNQRCRLRGAGLWQAKLRRAYLQGAKLSGADLHEADLSEADLSETDLEDALSLRDTKLLGVKGLTNKQLEACKANGAIIVEDPTTRSSQSTLFRLLHHRKATTYKPH